MNKIQQDLRLLPAHYKKYAFGILIFSIILIILIALKSIPVDKHIVKEIPITGILVSMFILAFTRNKVEDELTSKIRLKAFAGAFIFGAGSVIVEPFVNIFFEHSFSSDKGAAQLVMAMFIFYFIIFYLSLKNR
ncbi:MAG: hypothetical protein M0P27_02955 [Bacteroidales bacterium]|nr:hypothetical protein [Bacteroidales bacterium]